ncbi:MAG: hypothetical protein JWL92_16, partial [Candidatus Nomurabacteria bacterium]|nr:hypothetical protein [Candidatus Nomurabacteria bacterium]
MKTVTCKTVPRHRKDNVFYDLRLKNFDQAFFDERTDRNIALI